MKKREYHGRTRTPEYRAWQKINARCYSPTDKNVADYAQRGITVCDRWRHSSKAFLDDMGPRPAGFTIERLDNDGPYSPENCVWANRQQQAANRRTARRFTINGVTKCISEWSREMGVGEATLRARIRLGFTFTEAAALPLWWPRSRQ